jgi:hypothetical protein
MKWDVQAAMSFEVFMTCKINWKKTNGIPLQNLFITKVYSFFLEQYVCS